MLCAYQYFHPVNKASCRIQEYQCLNGIMPCTGDPQVECLNPGQIIMNKLNMTFFHCHSFKKDNIEQHLKFIRQSTFRLILFQKSDCQETVWHQGNFFVNQFSFIMNSAILIFLSLVFLTTKAFLEVVCLSILYTICTT